VRILIYIFIALVLFSCKKDTPVDNKEREAFEKKALESIIAKGKSGDIILKNGYGQISRTITKVLNEKIKISHCGILIVNEESNERYIIHSVAKQISDRDGIQTIDLERFIKDVKPGDLHMLRYKTDTTEKIKDEAICLLEKEIPFDHKYDLKNDNELYCSELIYKIFLNTYFEEVFERKPFGYGEILLFNPILTNKNFDIIIK